MTISTTTVRIAYDGDNVTTTFAVPFPFFAASELEVIERNVALGTETPKVLGTHYTVAGGDGASGTVTASAPPSSAVQWVVRRKTARTQTTDYTPNDPFPAETHEKALDRLTMIGQELGEESDRAMTFPKTDAIGLSPTLPASVARAGRVLAFDGTGVPTVSTKTLVQLESEADNAAASAVTAASSASAASSSAASATTSATSAATSATAANMSAVVAAAVAEKNVKSYGAVGDGVTDDTAAFTAAIAAAAGGALVVPEGAFIVSKLTLNNPIEIKIRSGGTIKQKANTNGHIFTVTSSDVTIRGGTLDGNKANQTTGNVAIQSTGNDRILIDGVTIQNTNAEGTYLVDGDDLEVRNCRGLATVGTAFQFFCTTKSVRRNKAVNCKIDRSDNAAYNGGCVKMTNNSGGTTFGFIEPSIDGCDGRMHTAPTGTGVVPFEIWAGSLLANHSPQILNCRAEGGGIQFSINGGIAGQIANCNGYSVGGLCSHELADCVNSVINGGMSDGASHGSHGAMINDSTATSTGNAIIGLTIRNVVIAIYIDANAENSVVSSNNIYNCTQGGIEANGPGKDGVAIVSNVVNATAQPDASKAGIRVINKSNVIIQGNWVKCTGNAIQLISTSGTRDHITVGANYLNSTGASIFNMTGANFGTDISAGWNANYLVGSERAQWYDIQNARGMLFGTDDPIGGSLDWVSKGSYMMRTNGGAGQELAIKQSVANVAGWAYVNMTQRIEITIAAANLASAAKKTLVTGISTGRFKVRGIKLTGITGLSGGGGDRNVRIQDNSGTTIWSTMTAAAIGGVTPLRWGDAGVPFDSASSQTAQSVAGEALVAVYQGGTTDYSAGSITIILEYERTT
jgi:hypothetical protein